MAKLIQGKYGVATNEAANRRRDAKFRAWLCQILGCPVDSCFTTSELMRDAQREGKGGWWARDVF